MKYFKVMLGHLGNAKGSYYSQIDALENWLNIGNRSLDENYLWNR